jgi:hypothetical protein
LRLNHFVRFKTIKFRRFRARASGKYDEINLRKLLYPNSAILERAISDSSLFRPSFVSHCKIRYVYRIPLYYGISAGFPDNLYIFRYRKVC